MNEITGSVDVRTLATQNIRNQQNDQPNVWANFNPQKLVKSDSRLEYVSPMKENGIEFCVIEEKDIKSEIEYWANSVVVYVLGANPPFHVMYGFLNRVWKGRGFDKIIQV